MRQGSLLQMRVEQVSEIVRRNKPDQFFQDVAIGIQQIEFGLEREAKRSLKSLRVRVVRVEVTEFDPAVIFRFEPMNHGRHGSAGRSGEAEEFNQLQPARSKVDRGRIAGFERVAARCDNRLNGRRCCKRGGFCVWRLGRDRNVGRGGGFSRGAGNCQKDSDQAQGESRCAKRYLF